MTLVTYTRAFGFLSILFLASCSGEPSQEVEWPIIPGAKNIKSYNLKKEKAHQLSFEVNATYPSRSVANFYSKQVKKPWVPCYQKLEWQSFRDDTKVPPVYVHQLLLHWANYENNQLLLLGVRYVSKGTDYRNVPENNLQNVNLVEYQEVNVKDVVANLGLDCGRT